MDKLLKLILSLLFCFTAAIAIAQNKYAVLVAVNDYYSAPNEKHPRSLAGCVNDAESIKGLLVNRFGFEAGNIFSLYNSSAKKKNFVDLLRKVYQKTKPGDALIFFYSGHGVWMHNPNLEEDSLKRGMSQAIVMSDLYSTGWDCLISDEMLKSIFNQFVDNKVIVTSIIDCCFSATLMASPGPSVYWRPEWWAVPDVKKDLTVASIPYIPNTQQPQGCTDSLSRLIDSDNDGVPDCEDWEVNTPPGNQVDSLGVCYEPDPQNFLGLPDNYYHPSGFTADTTEMVGIAARSFNLKDVPTVTNRSSLRPADRKNGKFISLAGTADNQKGIEITDISGNRHGAFTAALLAVYKMSKSNLSISELLDKLTTMMVKQRYQQVPHFLFDSSRLKTNLIGLPATGFADRIKATCISNKKGMITVNKGTLAMLSRGNTLTTVAPGVKYKIQLLRVYDDSAVAIDKTNGAIKPGQVFELTDDYTISDPFISIYIPSAFSAPADYDAFFRKKIMPYVQQPNYGDYNYSDVGQNVSLIFWDNEKKLRKNVNNTQSGQGELLYVLLPVPGYLAAEIRKTFAKDQNVAVVDDPRNANFGLYLNYVKPRDGKKAEYVFYLHPLITEAANSLEGVFSKDNISRPSLIFSEKDLKSFCRELSQQVSQLIRLQTKTWMNTYPKR